MDEEADEDDIDGDDQAEYESTDSMTSANHVASYALPLKKFTEIKHPFLVKRVSTTGGAIFYQARTGLPHQLCKETPVQTQSAVQQCRCVWHQQAQSINWQLAIDILDPLHYDFGLPHQLAFPPLLLLHLLDHQAGEHSAEG